MGQPLAATPSLNPVLQAALGSLDIQLEVELGQYRCHKTVRRLPPWAHRAKQDRIGKIDTEVLLEKNELATTQPENTYLNLNNFSNSASALISHQDTSPEPTGPLTLEAYLELTQARGKNLEETKASTNGLLQSLFKPLAVATIVSLLLSIALSYVIISPTINGVGSKTCQAEATRHLCNTPTSGDR